MNKQSLKELLHNPNPVILDIGCYDGKDSKELADIFNCEIHCFEPDPLSQDVFLSKHFDDHRLKLYGCALTNVDGEIDFYQSTHPQSNSTREPKEHINLFPTVKFDELTVVESRKLDTWYHHILKDKIIDFIWADVNGSEKDLIEGGLYALSKTRYIYIEVSKKELYAGQQHYNFLDKLLPDFEMILMDNWGDSFGNVLLKNSKL